ncbi:MAG: nucleoside diphosphate kinase [bacterium]|nr:MAG: nucleoside diphosphate kinase [bacterium]
MSVERTLGLIKPDALERGMQGRIIDRILTVGFKITAMKQMALLRPQAEAFYREHEGKPFFGSLCDYMTSGPIIAMTLERENAIKDWRVLMGATNPENADEGTIRKEFAVNLEKNSVHGSDSTTSAHREVPFFFNRLEY